MELLVCLCDWWNAAPDRAVIRCRTHHFKTLGRKGFDLESALIWPRGWHYRTAEAFASTHLTVYLLRILPVKLPVEEVDEDRLNIKTLACGPLATYDRDYRDLVSYLWITSEDHHGHRPSSFTIL
jgi:hypothetical protein